MTKSIDAYMKLTGHNYLVQCIKPLIDLVYASEDKPFEIDPMKFDKKDVIATNLANMKEIVAKTMDLIYNNFDNLPM